jgi:hypothetical protein
MPKSPAQVITDLIANRDSRAKGMPPGSDIELARQKLLFFTTPAEFPAAFAAVSKALDADFAAAKPAQRERAISFVLGIAESLASPVELSHNLQNTELHGKGNVMTGKDAAGHWRAPAGIVGMLAKKDKKAFLAVTLKIKSEDLAVNDGDNLFAAWAKCWEKRNGRDPYATVEDYLDCFSQLYQPGMYYPDLHFAREAGKTRTQFLADRSEHAVRARRMGCLGCYTKVRTGKAEPVEQTSIPFRSIYLVRGLGIPGPSDVIKQFDAILLDGADKLYQKAAAGRAGDNDIRAVFYHLGQTSDKIRKHRVKTLVAAQKETSKFKGMDPGSVRSLRDEPTNNVEFILLLKEKDIEFKPGDEEDAIDHAGALLVKRAAVRAKNVLNVIADKRNYLPNIELLDVDYATDSPEVQRECMMGPVEVDNWKSLWEDMDKKGNPVPGSVWAKRADILTAIWPDWENVFKSAGA